MELLFFVGGVLTTAAIAVVGLAYRHSKKWPVVLAWIISAGSALFVVATFVVAMAGFVFFVGQRSETARDIAFGAIVLAIGLAGLTALAHVANWLRPSGHDDDPPR